MYHNIRDALNKGDNNPENVGKATILPASFTGSKRYMNQYFKDAMAIYRTLGHPSLFLMMTTNIKWPEILRMLRFLPGVDVVDAPDVVARVFKMKVDQLLDQIKNKNYFGRCIGVMHVIEFQKRGLPHAHMLIWLHPNDRPKTTKQIDKMVSTEIPDPSIDPVGYEAVKNYMIHVPCGTDCVKSPCMVKVRCIKHFPKRYNSHTYFDDCGFPIYKRRKTGITEVFDNAGTKKSKLEAWFDANKTYAEAPNLTYSEFSSKFTWHPQPGIWKQRKRGDVIGRLAEVHSSSGELLYLRMLLLRIKGVVYFDDLKTVNGHVYNSFHEACAALEIEKLLNDIGKSLRNFPDMPYPGDAFFSNSENRLILEEKSYDIEELKRIHTRNHSLLNDEQKIVYDSILDNINQKKGGVFFVYGSGGCRKTFLWQALCFRLRSEHKIVLPVASCTIAAVLLPGGRTAHSRFQIPLKLDENCSTGLRHGTYISELLQ
ncbi:uncharacterized protein LOC141690517 [Apium graveolens]|uniref:uncharacterized protein LOC141690517 n=1 Tax=Apium graveolens TaxID=4045 RepID=UPI003D7AD873